ncbi:M14 family zinc carboxypeptidase [Candidatus Zixiibacteriota bacterium]
MKKVLSTLIVLLMIPVCVQAQTIEPFEWYPDGTYNASIPTPWDFLGYQIGDDYTWHHDLLAYMEAVAAASDRVTIGSYGQTYEGRDLILMTISSPGNLARAEEIRGNMAALADPRGAQNSQLQSIIENSPAVAWLTYNVHGSESAGTEAAILTVYQLAAGTDQVTRNILDELVVIIAPLHNPDGRDRVVASHKKRSGSNPDASPEAWEHGSDWPGGRSNHFMFDLNRDWGWQTQIETQSIISHMLQWNPVVHVDFHEMGGDSYFFFPAATPVHDAIPDVVMKWQQYYGEGNAAAFDRFGWPYYTKVGFDMYYPGFGDSWPSMMGAIGMTYEQGGGAAGSPSSWNRETGQSTPSGNEPTGTSPRRSPPCGRPRRSGRRDSGISSPSSDMPSAWVRRR